MTSSQTASSTRTLMPVAVAVPVALTGGVAAAVQATINGGLAQRVGTPIIAALVSNGLATVLLIIAALTIPSVRTGLRELRQHRLRWWQYLGGLFGATFVVGSALAVPILGVALFTVAQVSGTSLGGVLTDRVGLGPAGKLAAGWPRLAAAGLAVVAVAIAQVGRPVGQIAIGMIGFVLLLGVAIPAQTALNGRVIAVAHNVGSASLVNAVVGTSLLGLIAAGFGTANALPFEGWPDGWWFYLGGVLSLVVTGASLLAVRSIGVLRSGLCMIAGQLTGGLLLDAVIPGGNRPTPWLVIGAALTIGAVLLSGRVSARPVTPRPQGVDQPE